MDKRIGAEYLGDNKCRFTVWAPEANQVHLVVKNKTTPIPLEKEENGYWSSLVTGISTSDKYKFRLDGENKFPDPASRFQPEGVHSWSQVTDSNTYKWSDKGWKGIPISEMIIYEIHVGTFTPKGTFSGIKEKLDYLEELGVNTLEIMPIAQFPGERNWGYDGVYPFAVQNSYGSIDDLKRLIDSCHKRNMAVILDVVYNHLGPEGNYLHEFGPYFIDKYVTPWGKALNFDDKYSDEIRNFFLQNALRWLEEFHFDGLRLDAVHEIIDRGANHFLKDLSREVDKLQEKSGKSFVLIAESDRNDRYTVADLENGGLGMDGQWVDDFHHSLHTVLTGEKEGYYADFGLLSQLGKSFKQGFVYDGVYSNFRKRTVGNKPKDITPARFVVCTQNHDQVGNRMLGDRLSQLIDFECLKLAAGILMISPFTPMLFMGEEFAETRNFQYFVNHGDPDLVKAVQEGRKSEFEYFLQKEGGDFPDPQSKQTFLNSKLTWEFSDDTAKTQIFELYKHLIRLRKKGAFKILAETNFQVETNEQDHFLKVIAESSSQSFYAHFNFSEKPQRVSLPKRNQRWKKLVASCDKAWGGPIEANVSAEELKITPHSFIVLDWHKER